jgi:multidrug resistance efflux pump
MKRIDIKGFPLRLRHHILPIVVWLFALICVIGLFSRRTQRFEVIGIAQGKVVQISANCPARLVNVPVRLFDKVTQGQTLAVINAVLDNEQPRGQLQAQLATVLAEIDHLTAQLVPTQDSLTAEKTDREASRILDSRRFSVDVENARLEILRLRALIETDRITLKDLELEVNVTKELLKQDAVVPYELQKAQAQYDTLATKISENEQLLAQANTALEQTIKRRDQYFEHEPYHPSVEGALDVVRKAIRVQERRMDEVLLQIEALDVNQALELKAPFDGVISQIMRGASEAVLAGDPILTLTEAGPTEVIAYVSEEQVNSIRQGMEVELIKSSEPARIIRSRITYIGPVMEQLPVRFWRNQNVPQWGRPFLIDAPSEIGLVTGELVGIRKL